MTENRILGSADVFAISLDSLLLVSSASDAAAKTFFGIADNKLIPVAVEAVNFINFRRLKFDSFMFQFWVIMLFKNKRFSAVVDKLIGSVVGYKIQERLLRPSPCGDSVGKENTTDSPGDAMKFFCRNTIN